ncbi:MAG: glutaredoxin family protein [candidate division Zixibacteria bacterium]|nr:glutaredoxin family protein [candidate division Zixibacteria bacterium]
MSDVVIYTKTGCPYCAAAKKHYADQGIGFTEFNVTDRPEFKKKVLELTGGQSIVPVIVEGSNVTVGFGGG